MLPIKLIRLKILQSHHYNYGKINQRQLGFTLIELMVVVVILSVFASMITLSVGGSENRRMQALHQKLQDDLNYVRLVAADQMQPMGLAVLPATATQPSQLAVVVYAIKPKLAKASTNTIPQPVDTPSKKPQPQWLIDSQFNLPTLPEGVLVSIKPLILVDNQSMAKTPSKMMQDPKTPKLLWLGNGEATPARIVLHYQDKPIGEPIFVTATGQVTTDSTKAGL